ncbi:4Fe-4S binding protein, partial [Acinetobacter sp. 163]|nr:4Fe-4S binding protein [Acinetobacter sp. 163]
RKACDNGCIGCKKCEKTCKFDAVHVENNVAFIDPEKCKNCGMCAKECPTGAINNMRLKKVAAKKVEA